MADSGESESDKGKVEDVKDGQWKEEEVSIESGCKLVRDFIWNLRNRGEEGMTSRSTEVIEAMKGELIQYLNEEELLKDDMNRYLDNYKRELESKLVSKSEMKSENKNNGKKLPEYNFKSKGKQSISSKETDVESRTSRNKGRRNKSSSSSRNETSDDSIDGDSNSEESSREESSYSEEERTKSTPKKRKEPKKKSKGSVNSLLKGIDNRKVPKMESYNDDSGQDFRKYLKRFEKYCEENVKGGNQYWISELEAHLKGEILDTFEFVRDYDDEYDDVKYKLMKWYRNNADRRKRQSEKKFKNARPKEKESLYIFSIRSGLVG